MVTVPFVVIPLALSRLGLRRGFVATSKPIVPGLFDVGPKKIPLVDTLCPKNWGRTNEAAVEKAIRGGGIGTTTYSTAMGAG